MLAHSYSYSKRLLKARLWGQDMHTCVTVPGLKVFSEAWLGSIASGCTDAQDLRLGQGTREPPVFLASEICRGSDA